MPGLELWTTALLLDISIKAALLAIAAGLAMACFRVRGSHLRHRVWLLVLVGMLLLPGLVHFVPGISLPHWLYPNLQVATVEAVPDEVIAKPIAEELPIEMETADATPFEPMVSEPATVNVAAPVMTLPVEADEVLSPASVPVVVEEDVAAQSAATIPAEDVRQRSSNRWAMTILLVYLIGVAYQAVRLLLGILWTVRLVRRARTIQTPLAMDWLPRSARIVESGDVRVPLTIGYWRPVVVLPADWANWSETFLAMVLAHEGEHVRRRDTWAALLATVNCVVYWFHPVAWFVRRRLTDLAEQVCDDTVIQITGSRGDYAQNLLEMASRLSAGTGRLQPVGVAMARKANVVRRIEAIIDRDRPLARRLGTLAALLLLAAVVPLIFLAAGLRASDSSAAVEEEAVEEEGADLNDASETDSSATKPADDAAEPESSPKGIKGRVAMATDDAPVAGAEVWLLSPKKSGLDKKSKTTNERGEFEFTKLTEGRKILAAYYENLASRTKRYKGREAKLGEQGIVLRLSEAPSLKVKVVTRADSKPLEDATVRLTWTDAKQDHKTDANGEVLIRGLTAETWTIETHAKGYAEDVQAISLRGTETASVTARLDPGIELYGVVRDEEGQGLPGAGISVFPSGLSGKQIEYMETEADGSFRFPYLPIMGFTLIVSKEGYVETRPPVAVTVSPGGRQELNLTLARRPDGGSVQGIVVDKAGYPVDGAKIINRGATIPRDTRETTTDAEGRYRLDDVFDSLGDHRLFISAKGFAPQILQFEPGEREKPTQLDVTLEPGHRVRGRVVSEEGEALAGVEIYYGFSPQFSDSDHGGTARTDSEGRFELDSLPAAPPIRFRKGGYSEIREETFPLDGEEEVVITMRSPGVLRGRVADAQTGRPVKSFTVRVTFSPDRQPGDPSGGLSGARVFGGETFSTEDGTFRMDDFIHGMPLQVTVKADGYDPAVVRRVVAVPEENAEEVKFRLTPVDRSELLTIAGRLVNEQGTALPGAEMRLIVATKRPFPRDAFPFNWTMIRSGQVQDQDSVLQFMVAVTDPQGRFTFEQVRNAGDIELAYWGEGVSQARKAHLKRLSAEALTELTITAKTPGIVQGKIDRKAYPNVSNIMLSGNLEFFEASLSLKRDSYEIRNVPEGSYELQVYVPSARKDEYGRVDSSVIRRGRVSVQSGQTVTLNIERETSKSPPPDRPGKEGPSDGAGKAVTKPKPEEPDKDMERAESASLEVDGANETEITVRGTVTDESGKPIPGARLWLPLKFDETRTAEATADSEGEFTLHVPVAWTKPDESIPFWVVWCYGAGRQIAAASAYKQLMKGSKASIAFVLEEPTDTGFEVRDPEGKPLRGAKVEPYHFRVGSYYIVPETLRDLLAKETDAEGRVRLPEIARDKLSNVRVTIDGFGIQEQRLRDSANEPAVRTIQLRRTGRIEGRLVSDNEAAIRKRRIYISQEDYGGEHTSGAAMVETDEEGRFVVPALAEGKIRLGFRVDRSIPLRPRIPEDLVVYAGETTQVEVPMEKTVRVRGRVQTKGEGLPVAGAMISVQYGAPRQSDHVQTDEDGWFEADALAGAVRRQLIMKPDRYSEWIVEDAGWQHRIDVPRVENFELPPLELIETVEVAGQLVDREGQSVANAHVRAITGDRVYAWGTSDSDGRFTLRLPKDFHVEEYDASRTHDEGQVETSVKQESPLVLQLIQ